MFADELAGRRLVFTGDNKDGQNFGVGPTLVLLDENILTPDIASHSLPLAVIEISVFHPYAAENGAFGDETVRFSMVEPPTTRTGLFEHENPVIADESDAWGSYPLAVFLNLGNMKNSATQHYQDLQAVAPFTLETVGALPCRPSSFMYFFSNWCQFGEIFSVGPRFGVNRGHLDRMVNGISGTVANRLHDIGIVYASRAKNHRNISLQSSLGVAPLDPVDVDGSQRAYQVTSLLTSQLEYGVIQGGIDGTNFGTTVARILGAEKEVDPGIANITSSTLMANYIASLPVTSDSFEQEYRTRLQQGADAGYSAILRPGGRSVYFYKGR